MDGVEDRVFPLLASGMTHNDLAAATDHIAHPVYRPRLVFGANQPPLMTMLSSFHYLIGFYQNS